MTNKSQVSGQVREVPFIFFFCRDPFAVLPLFFSFENKPGGEGPVVGGVKLGDEGEYCGLLGL